MARELSDRDREEAAAMRSLTDDQVAMHVANSVEHVAYPMEMQRRLVVALKAFKKSSDVASRRLLWATWVLVALTVAIVVLTVVLAVRT